jgi:hypothetical protein
MARTQGGSLTKELPLRDIENTISAIRPGMTLDALRKFAKTRTHASIPGLLIKRFLLISDSGTIAYDKFLSVTAVDGIGSARVRKIMYLVWALREPRLGRFIREVVADRNGKWRVGELTKLSNAKFFQEFFKPSTTLKVRSNTERFLVECGILDRNNKIVHLELDDDWVIDALEIAAQHEFDLSRRRAMAGSPIRFLIENGLNGLVNATPDELRAIGDSGPVSVREPLEDLGIEANVPKKSVSQTWNRATPTAMQRRQANAAIDIVARERASKAHWMLERVMNNLAVAKGYVPKQNQNIDMHFAVADGHVLIEMKSCHRGNLHSQVRRGVAQLFEYRFRYSALLGDDPALVLIIETVPANDQAWLISFLESLEILLAWKDSRTDRLIASSTIPAHLDGIVSPLIKRA